MAHMLSSISRIALGGLIATFAVAPFSTALSAPAIPDLEGNWARTTFGFGSPTSGPGPVDGLRGSLQDAGNPNVGNENSPILKPAAVAAVKRKNESQAAGVVPHTPSNNCWPMAVPYIYRVQGMQLLQLKDRVVMLYLQDHQIRHIRLNARHSENVVASWYGDSIGHYEGDTLVVDTIGFKVGPIAHVDRFGSPYSGALHVVERYSLIDVEAAEAAQDRNVRENGAVGTEQAAIIDPLYEGKGLQVAFTVEDSNFFTTPWSGTATYRKAATEWGENVCAENRHVYFSERDTPVPEADAADF